MTLHPDFPVVEGHYRLSREWSLHLPCKVNRRTGDGNVVLWRPGLTLWATIRDNLQGESRLQRAARQKLQPGARPDSVEETWKEQLLFLSYRLDDDACLAVGGPVYCCHAFGDDSHVDFVAHYEHEAELKLAQAIGFSAHNATSRRLAPRR
jgi:hypothetical protein